MTERLFLRRVLSSWWIAALAFVFSLPAAAAQCGSLNQTPCPFWERPFQPCDKGLVENYTVGKCIAEPPAPPPAYRYLKDGFGKCLHVPEETRNNGVQLRTWDCIGKDHLKWEYVAVTEGRYSYATQYFLLRNQMTRKCAAVHKGQNHDGAWVVQWDCPPSGEAPPHFQWVNNGTPWSSDGRFLLVHRESGKCVHTASGDQYATVTVTTCPPPKAWTVNAPNKMRWQFASGPVRRTVRIMAGGGITRCLRAYGGMLRMSDCTDGDDGLWIQHRIGTSDSWYYKNLSAEQCLAVRAGEKHDGAAAILTDCDARTKPQPTNLHWMGFEWMGKPYGQLANGESGTCLSFEGSTLLAMRPCVAVPNNLAWTRPQ